MQESKRRIYFSLNLILIFLIHAHSQLVCTSNVGLCKCPATGVNIDGSCRSCMVPHCRLCSTYSTTECDVCSAGYVLDSLTKSTCVPAVNSALVCQQGTCQCSPYQVKQNGRCLSCAVSNCRLCST